MKFTITFEVPDGTTYQVNAPEVMSGGAVYVAPFEDELIPLPEGAMPIQGDPTPFRGAAQNTPSTICPVHKLPWKMVPAGVSKRTGATYAAFAACPERGCTQRPAA